MNWEYTPKKRGLQVTLLTHQDPILGFQYRILGFSISLLYISLYVFWFDRKEYEEDLHLLANSTKERR